ncbi:erg24, C-14 sterol reductase [Sorochytrium milnesiophthora]
MVAIKATQRSQDKDMTATMKEVKATATLNPRSTEFEFLGPVGASALIFGMPLVVLALTVGCSEQGCPPSLAHLEGLWSLANRRGDWRWLFNGTDLAIYVCWILWCAACHYFLPGERKKGVVLRNGKQLDYKLAAFNTFLFTLGAFLLIVNFHGLEVLVYVADHCLPLATAGIAFSLTTSAYLYARSFAAEKRGDLLALGGNSGNPIYDFFIGRELNPRILNNSFDLKCFFELRPGLIGWMVLNFAFMAKQYVQLGGRVTDSMVLVVLFESIYVIDALYNEVSVLTTMDITTDGFGFMLCLGDIVWVPFNYSLQARYLSMYPNDLGLWGVTGVLLVNALGYYIFRSANTQKDIFRNNPNDPRVKHLKYMDTERGTRLLISGWWGTARHINYFGDWLMSVAWSLPCGFAHFPIPYFYPIYFAVLLVHRFYRDEHSCRKKYGKDWDKYCRIVRWRIIPGIF